MSAPPPPAPTPAPSNLQLTLKEQILKTKQIINLNSSVSPGVFMESWNNEGILWKTITTDAPEDVINMLDKT